LFFNPCTYKVKKLVSKFAFTFNLYRYSSAPVLRVAAHWIAWTTAWRGVKDHERAMHLSGLCGHFAGTDVTLLALLILSWRMGDTSETFSRKQGGCIAGECFRITVKMDAGAHAALFGVSMSCGLAYAMGRLQAQARVAVLEGAAAGAGGNTIAAVRSKWDLPYASPSGGPGRGGSYGSLTGEGHGGGGGAPGGGAEDRDDHTAW
jgi:hypothetical protein